MRDLRGGESTHGGSLCLRTRSSVAALGHAPAYAMPLVCTYDRPTRCPVLMLRAGSRSQDPQRLVRVWRRPGTPSSARCPLPLSLPPYLLASSSPTRYPLTRSLPLYPPPPSFPALHSSELTEHTHCAVWPRAPPPARCPLPRSLPPHLLAASFPARCLLQGLPCWERWGR